MGSQGKHRSSTQSHSFKVKAKNRVEDLQGMFCSLQQARRENRGVDVGVLEEQVNQMLREWKAELHDPTPSSSLVVMFPFIGFLLHFLMFLLILLLMQDYVKIICMNSLRSETMYFPPYFAYDAKLSLCMNSCLCY